MYKSSLIGDLPEDPKRHRGSPVKSLIGAARLTRALGQACNRKPIRNPP
jgi:hypothetical protein